MSLTQIFGRQIAPIDLSSAGAEVTGALPLSNGGTGQTTASTAINALVPTQTGNSGKVLGTDGTVVSWVVDATGGGGGGGAVAKQDFTNQTTVPTTPASGTTSLFSELKAGRSNLAYVGQSSESYNIQPAISSNYIAAWQATSGISGFVYGTTGLGQGTFTAPAPASTTKSSSLYAGNYSNVATTANQQLGYTSNALNWWRGNAAGLGGFFFFARFGLSAWANGGRLFVGMSPSTNHVTANPSAGFNAAGFGVDSTDTAITFMTNGASGVATKAAIAGQPALAAGNMYDAYIYCPPNGSSISWRLENFNTGALIGENTQTLTLPVNTAFMTFKAMASNAALTPVGSIGIRLNRIYVESDI